MLIRKVMSYLAQQSTVKRATRQNAQQTAKFIEKKQVSVVEPVEEDVDSVGLIAIDNGGQNTKILNDSMDKPVLVYSAKGFGSDMGLWGNFNIGDDGQSYRIKWNDKHYFTGVFLHHAEGQLNPFVNNKDDDYYILSILLACALYGFKTNYVVTCSPISRYSVEEINAVTNRLVGEHTIEINFKEYNFRIDEVLVSPETTVASASLKPEGVVRWLDLGSRTVGYATTVIQDGLYMPVIKESGTIEKEGLNIKTVRNYSSYVTNLTKVLNKFWDEEDRVIAFGGGAEIPALIEELKNYYPNLEVARDPIFLQVKGMLALGYEEFAFLFEDEGVE